MVAYGIQYNKKTVRKDGQKVRKSIKTSSILILHPFAVWGNPFGGKDKKRN